MGVMTERGRKILFGAIAALGGVAILCIAIVVGLVVWVMRPGEVIDPERLRDGGAVGYGEWTLSLDDPGTEGFVTLLTETLLTAAGDGPADVPEALGELADNAFPAVAVWTLHAAPGSGADRHLVGVASVGIGNAWVAGDRIAAFLLDDADDPISVHEHGAERIYVFEELDTDFQAALFARSGGVFAASDLDTARRAVDLLDAPADAVASVTELGRLFEATSGALRIVLTNTGGVLARLVGPLGVVEPVNPEVWSAVTAVTVTGGFQADGAFAAVVELASDDPGVPSLAAAPMAEALLRAGVDELGDLDPPLDLDVEIETVEVATGVRIDVRVPGLVDALAERMPVSARPNR